MQIYILYQCFIDRQFQPGKNDPEYNSYGVTCTEVEMDVLTGQHLINRVDILYDCGERYGVNLFILATLKGYIIDYFVLIYQLEV